MAHITHHHEPARHWQDWVNMILGALMVASPWLLGFALYDPARLAHLAIGILVVAVAVLEVWQSRPRS